MVVVVTKGGVAGRRRWRARVIAAIAAALPGLALLTLTSSIATGEAPLVRIGSAPRMPPGTVDVGALTASAGVSGTIVLRPRDERALQAIIAAATRRGAAHNRRYLRPGQFGARFGATSATIAALRARLARAGVRDVRVARDGLLVRFSGAAARVGVAFSLRFHRYRLRGRTFHAPTAAPGLPAPLARSVVAVIGLDSLGGGRRARVRRVAALAARLPAAKAVSFRHPPGSPHACTRARRAAASLGGLTDDQIAYAYGAFGLYAIGDTGSGTHVGVFEQEPFAQTDIRHFDSCYFGAAAAAAMMQRLHVVSLEGGIPQGSGSGESLLDIEDVSAMAPGAEIDVYENAESPAGEVAQIAAMVDEGRDQIITSSYGEPCEEEEEEGQPGTQQALDFLFQQGAAQGQTFLGAAGDNGSDNCEEVHRSAAPQPGQNPLSGGEIASQPYVLGVGGTTITAASDPPGEHVWNDGNEGGAAGGGISRAFAMPSWQRDSAVPGIEGPGSADYENAASVERRFGYPAGFCQEALPGAAAGTPCRLEPDVSAQADEFTGAITVYSAQYVGEGEEASPSGWITSGGTSSAAPIWAGMLALADASPTCRSNPATVSGTGFVSPLLYAIASEPSAYAASFNDITEGNNDQYGLDGGKVYPARPGFDLASGLGSPRMTGPGGSAGLAYYLCTYAGEPLRPSVTALSPSSGSTAGGEPVAVTGSGFERAGAPDVAGVTVGTWRLAATAVHVNGPSSLTLTMPPGKDTLPADSPPPQDGAGPANVVVTLNDGQSSATGPAAVFQYVDTASSTPVPSITGLLPTGGSESAPQPVTILGSDFQDARSVSFGGVAAASFKVLSGSQIRATPPPYSPATACSALPTNGPYAGENAGNDICQVQVVVHGSAGASATAAILPPDEGAAAYQQDGALVPPPGCGCEVYPVPTEYDYAPAPTISSVSTSSGPASLADERGGTLLTIRGAGLDRFTFLYGDFGNPALESSMFGGAAPYTQSPPYITGTEIQVEAPALIEAEEAPSVEPVSLPLSVRTLAGSSPQAAVQYAGVPTVSAVQNAASAVRLNGRSGAADTGGTPIVIEGKGLSGQVAFVRFQAAEGLSEGTQRALAVRSAAELETATVSEDPGLVDVEACTASGCSAPSPGDQLYLYSPGRPVVESLHPRSGSAAGATKVLIGGANLGCALGVQFGANAAPAVSNVPSVLACGDPSELEATSPAGSAGTKVPIDVTTWESYFTGTGDAPSRVRFAYSAG
jgi:hypothetical protein